MEMEVEVLGPKWVAGKHFSSGILGKCFTGTHPEATVVDPLNSKSKIIELREKAVLVQIL